MKASKSLQQRRINDIRQMHQGVEELPFQPYMANGWLSRQQMVENQFDITDRLYCHGGRYPFIYDGKGLSFIQTGDRIRFENGKRTIVRDEH